MNWDEIAGTWRQFRGKVKENVGQAYRQRPDDDCREAGPVCGGAPTRVRLCKSTIGQTVRAVARRAHPYNESNSSQGRFWGTALTSLGASTNGSDLLEKGLIDEEFIRWFGGNCSRVSDRLQ